MTALLAIWATGGIVFLAFWGWWVIGEKFGGGR